MATLYENYNTGDNGGRWFRDTNSDQECQTFTPSVSFTITYIKAYLQKVATGGVVTASIHATDGAGKPTVAVLCSGTYDASGITGTEWVTITFGSSYVLNAGTKYALVLSSDGWGFNWRYSTVAGYANGSRVYSTDNGSSWTVDTTDDFMFETWGDPAFSPPSSGPDITQIKRLVAAAANTIWYEDI